MVGATGFEPATNPRKNKRGFRERKPGTDRVVQQATGRTTKAGRFIAALGTACALFVVKYAGAGISALIAWAQDKFFPPVSIKAKVDASAPPESVPPNATGVVEFRGHDGIYEMEWDILVR